MRNPSGERCGWQDCGRGGLHELPGQRLRGRRGHGGLRVCEGQRVRPAEEMEPCGRCDGTGIELTELSRRFLSEAGPELLIFLSRWRGWRLR